MDILVEVTVPDGEYCHNEKEECEFSRGGDDYCFIFDTFPEYSKEPFRPIKLPECKAAPKAMECGHNPDALMTEYNDGVSWCAACHQMPDEVNHL